MEPISQAQTIDQIIEQLEAIIADAIKTDSRAGYSRPYTIRLPAK